MSRTNQVLAVLVVALAAFVLLVERRTDSTLRRAERARHAFAFAPDRVRRLAIECDGLRTECVRDDERWTIVRPTKATADAAAVQRILFGLEQMPRGEVITAADRRAHGTTLADFGLDRPRARVALAGEGVALSFDIGQAGPLGTLYLREEDHESIVATTTNLLGLLPSSPAALRDHTLLAGEVADVRRIQIRRPDGFLEAVRLDNGDWRLQQPLPARADREAVSALIADLLAFRIAEFVQDGVSDPSPWGFGEAAVEVTLDFAREDLPSETLLLGRPHERQPDRVYARIKNADSIFAVPVALRARLLMPVSRLRDRRLIPFGADEIEAFSVRAGDRELSVARMDGRWQILRPIAAPADAARVEEFLREWAGTRIEQFPESLATSNAAPPGFDPPSCRIALLRAVSQAAPTNAPSADTAATMPPEGHGPVILWIGAMPEALPAVRVAAADGEAFVRMAAKPPRYTAPDPLLYRDREVLRIRPADVQSFELVRGGVTQAVERTETGAFAAAAGGVTVDPAALERRLAVVADLQAQAFVAQDTTNLADYGLQPPETSITLGLRGEAGLAKTLLLGRGTPSGVHALVRGQDLVFLLDPRLVDALRAELWKKPPAAPAP